MKIRILFIILMISLNVLAQENIKKELQPYVEYLQDNNFLTAKDYILSKFQLKDIVIISERDHRDLSQYDVIFDVLKDSTFKGNIYTEVGTFNNYKAINSYLLSKDLSETEAEEKLLALYRDLDFSVVWEKYNHYLLLKTIYKINQSRNNEERILLFPLDIQFDWNEINCYEQMVQFDNLIENKTIERDLQMGKHFSVAYEFSKKRNPNRTHALVILNTFHGYIRIPSYLPLPNQPNIYSAGQYIFNTYPDITTNIYVNYYTQGFSKGLTNNGLFDAAFQYTKTDNKGFDLKDSPFGNAAFDLYNFGAPNYEKVNFDFIFDGMLFYKPASEWQLAIGIPNIYPKNLEQQFYERLALLDGISVEEAIEENKEYLQTINNLKIFDLDSEKQSEIKRQIDFWLD